MMISRIRVSLSVRPDFEQVRLQSFEFTAKRFHTSVDVFLGTLSVFQQKGQSSSAVQRNQGLNNMVTTYNGFVIRSRELKYGLGPYIRRVVEVANVQTSNSFQLRKCRL